MKGRALTISLSQSASFSTKIKIPLELVEFDKSIPLKFFFFAFDVVYFENCYLLLTFLQSFVVCAEV